MENEAKKSGQRKPLTKRQKKGTILFVVLLVAVAGLLWLFVAGGGRNWDALLRWTRFGNQEVIIGYEPGSVDQGEGFGSGLVTLNGTSLTIYNPDGDVSTTVAVKLSQPMLQTASSHVLAYDAGGTNLTVISDAGDQVLERESEGTIFDADLEPDGGVAVISEGSGDKTLLRVYNKNQKNIYTIHSTTRYYSRCALQPGSGQVAVVALGQQDGAFASTLVLYATDREGAQAEVDLGSQLILDVEYLSKDLICAVGEGKVILLNAKGQIQGSYVCDGDLVTYDYSHKGYVALVMRSSQGGGGWNLVTVNDKGKEIARVALAQEVTDLSVTGKYVAVLTPSVLTVYSRELEIWSTHVHVSGYSHVSMNDDGSAFLVGSEDARRFVP